MIKTFKDGLYGFGGKQVRTLSREHMSHHNVCSNLSPMKITEKLYPRAGMCDAAFVRMLKWPEPCGGDILLLQGLIASAQSLETGGMVIEPCGLWMLAAYILDCYDVDHPNELLAILGESGQSEAFPVDVNREIAVYETVIDVARHLGVSANQLVDIVGMSSDLTEKLPISSTPLDATGKTYELALLFIRIYQALYKLYHGDMEAMREWFRSECDPLHGEPMKVLGKIETLVEAVTYLEGAAFGDKEPLEGLVSAISDENAHPEIQL